MRELLESTVWHIEIRPSDPTEPKSPKVSWLRCQVQAPNPESVRQMVRDALGSTVRAVATDRNGAVYAVAARVRRADAGIGRVEFHANGVGESVLLHGPTPPEPSQLETLAAAYREACRKAEAADAEKESADAAKAAAEARRDDAITAAIEAHKAKNAALRAIADHVRATA